MESHSPSGKLHEHEIVYDHDSAFIKIAALFPNGKTLSIFDAGCGDGRLSRELVEQGHAVTGIDANQKAVEKARSNGIAAIQGDLESEWTAADSAYDVVLLLDVLEHTVNHEFLLKEALRILKPDGSMILGYPNHFDLRNRFSVLFGKGIVHWSHRKYSPRPWTYGHVRFLRLRDLLELLSTSGFQIDISQYNFMGGGVLPRRFLPSFVRKFLVQRYPELLSGKFILRVRPKGVVGLKKQTIILDRTPVGL